jgi:hypothetical protein
LDEDPQQSKRLAHDRNGEAELELIEQPLASKILKLSESTLEKDRTRTHPRIPFVKLGRRVLYRISDLREHIKKNVRR